MKKSVARLPEIKLVGLMVRTNNHIEMEPSTAKIGSLVQQYFHQEIASLVSNRVRPGTTFCVYTNYETDATGNYSYFIGEEVTAFDTLPPGLERCIIPSQQYTKFTTEPGAMPFVVIDAWQKIWQMSEKDLGGKRAYKADFELYDHRALDHDRAVLDLFIGVGG
jgi:predicted transcriptional regulator YdeE